MPQPISRRQFLTLGAGLLAGLCGACLPAQAAGLASTPAPTGAAGQARPNIVYIVTDDLDAASMEYMPLLKQHVAQRGLTFQNYLFNFALCCPSRTAVLTGMYAHHSGIYSNSSPDGGYARIRELRLEEQMLPVWLRAAGYRTALIGKYVNGYPGGKQADPALIPPGWSEWYSSPSGDPYSEYEYTLNENGTLVKYGSRPEDYGTDVYARKTLDFIQRSARERVPFFAYVAPYAPHSPFTPAPRHAELFPGVQAPRTASFNEADVSGKPLAMQQAYPLLTTAKIAEIDRQYRLRLQSLQAVDELVADVVQQLESLGILENTYLFFASDNGYHQGQHRMPSGKTMPYEEDIRVPLLVRGPGTAQGKTSQALVGNVDLAATLVELAGAAPAAQLDGRSLAGLFRGETPAGWRQVYLLEHGAPQAIPEQAQTAGKKKAAAWSQGLRSATHTYVEYPNGECELYDLRRDSDQLHNLASATPAAQIRQLSELTRRLRAAQGADLRALEAQTLPI